MSLNLIEKKAVVADVKNIAGDANALVGSFYHGLTVGQMTVLRAEARAKGVCLRVVKNSLAKLALAGTNFENVNDKLIGPIILAFSNEEPNAGARIFSDLLKNNPNLDKDMVQFLWFEGEVLSGGSLAKIASLPTKDEAISLLMACMREPIAKLARTLAEVQKTKGSAMPAPEVAPEPVAEVAEAPTAESDDNSEATKPAAEVASDAAGDEVSTDVAPEADADATE